MGLLRSFVLPFLLLSLTRGLSLTRPRRRSAGVVPAEGAPEEESVSPSSETIDALTESGPEEETVSPPNDDGDALDEESDEMKSLEGEPRRTDGRNTGVVVEAKAPTNITLSNHGGNANVMLDVSYDTFAIPQACPTMPTAAADWENSHLWAVFFDGKDALKGPHVYDWDRKFFYRVSETLTHIYANEQTDAGRAPLTIELVEKLRQATYQDKDYNEICYIVGVDGKKTRLKGHGKKPKGAECKNGNGGNGIMPRCTDQLECKEVDNLLLHMPSYLYTFNTKRSEAEGCKRGLKGHSKGKLKSTLKKLIADYNARNADILARQTQAGSANTPQSKDELLESLVQFARAFAFLHPFANGNGRLRNMMVQREIRRLGIGCGTMMYNYNKDAFVDGFDRYVGKMKEGLSMFQWGIAHGTNPWLNNQTRADHEARFEVLSGLEKCASASKFGSGGNINFGHIGRRNVEGEVVFDDVEGQEVDEDELSAPVPAGDEDDLSPPID